MTSSDGINYLFAEWLEQYFGKHWRKEIESQELENLRCAYRAGHLDARTEIRLEEEQANAHDV